VCVCVCVCVRVCARTYAPHQQESAATNGTGDAGPKWHGIDAAILPDAPLGFYCSSQPLCDLLSRAWFWGSWWLPAHPQTRQSCTRGGRQEVYTTTRRVDVNVCMVTTLLKLRTYTVYTFMCMVLAILTK